MGEIAAGIQKQKIVVHLEDGTIQKGYLRAEVPRDLEALLALRSRSFPRQLELESVDDGQLFSVDIQNAKAVFFVKSFDGNKRRHTVKFYANGPSVQAIWVQVVFNDGETVEGAVNNSLHHLVEPGFFLKPSDPESNNELLYVLKSWIKEYRVLGVRSTY